MGIKLVAVVLVLGVLATCEAAPAWEDSSTEPRSPAFIKAWGDTTTTTPPSSHDPSSFTVSSANQPRDRATLAPETNVGTPSPNLDPEPPVMAETAAPEIEAAQPARWRDWGVPCQQPFTACERDDGCMDCFDPFSPMFNLENLESCEGMEEAFDHSCASTCDTDNQNLAALRQCVINEWFNILTLGAVSDFCSPHAQQQPVAMW